MIDLEFGFWVNINNTNALAKTKMTPYSYLLVYIFII